MKTEILNNQTAIIEHLKGLTESELVGIFNTYCQEAQYMDDYIYLNDEEFFSSNFTNPLEAVRAAIFGSFQYHHKFIKFNGYANLETTDAPTDWIDLSELSSYILDNPDAFDIELTEEEAA